MTKPNMHPEVIEAIKEYYKDYPDIIVDCLLYLGEDDELYSMGYCPNCGSELIDFHYREYHPEVDAYENLVELACPCCDFTS